MLRKRRRLTAVLMLALASCAGCALAQGRPTGSNTLDQAAWLNVRSLGATADGRADDTAAFEKALVQGRRQGKPVFVPRGVYRITRTLRLRDQLLTGQFTGGWPADNVPLPTLRIEHTNGPGVALEAFSSLHGIALFYPEHTRFPPQNAPPAISLQGQQPTLSSIRIQYPYDGIVTAPRALPGRARFSDIFIVAPTHDGVFYTRSLDVAQFRNIEVWCNGAMSTGAGFRLGRNDDFQGSDLFAFNCRAGFAFETDTSPGEGAGIFFGSLSNSSTDACATGYLIKGDHRINLSTSNSLSHGSCLDVDGAQASVRLTNCLLQSNGAPNIRIVDAANVIVSNVLFTRSFPADFYYVEASNCGSLTITSCQFRPLSKGILLDKGVRRAIIANNIFERSGEAITDRTVDGARKILTPNLE